MSRTIEPDLTIRGYKKRQRKKLAILTGLLVLTVLLFFFSLFVGQGTLSFSDNFMGIFGQGTNKANIIVKWNRMPRTIAGLACGIGLALSGVVMQSVLENPMASPSTLGVTNAAVLGANFAIIVLGAGGFANVSADSFNMNNPYAVTTCAFVSSLIAILFILALSKFQNFKPSTVILAGIANGVLCSALTTFIQYFAREEQVAGAVYWSFGDLGRASYNQDWILLGTCLFALVVLFLFSHSFNAMRGGEKMAKSLGVNLPVVRGVSLLLASLMTAFCVSFLGIIGFIGLLAPHIMKRFIGNDHRYLIPASALTGASILISCDMIARVVVQGVEMPVGAITSLIGAPVFLYILLRRKTEAL